MTLVAPLRYGTATEEIVSRYWERKRAQDPRLGALLELKDAVEDRMVVPLPEQDRSERPLNANLIASGLYGYAERSASVLPDVRCPPAREGDFDVHLRHANQRRNAIRGWWAMNRLDLALVKRFLHFYAYACSPVVIRPRAPGRHKDREIPYWHIRDPLSTLPPPGDDIDPADCIFTFQRSLGWLYRNYPVAAHALEKPKDCGPDVMFDCIEYVDDEITALVVLGQTSDRFSTNGQGSYVPSPNGLSRGSGAPWVEVEWAPNRAGICPAVVPGRICLDERMGQFQGLAGSQWWAGKLMALAANAAIKDVYADEWFEHAPGQTGQIIATADGARGILGEVSGGQIKSTHAPPGAASFLVLDRVTESIRHTGGIPAELQGESANNIRTARRGSQVLSSAVDYPMATAQKVMAAALEEENVRAIAVVKTCYSSGPKSFYFSWNNRGAYADYDATTTFDTDRNEVRYPFPGTNINELVVGAGQRLGMGAMSKRSWMEADPMVEDPEKEYGRVTGEAIEQAILQGFQNQVAEGSVPLSDAARIVRLIKQNGKSLADAIEQVQKEAQRRQASSGPPGTPEGPVPPGAPEAQPGLAVPGAGAEAPTAIPPEAGAMQNLSSIMQGLRRTSRSPAA